MVTQKKQVTRCMMVWHAQGNYLAVKVTRHTKSKKTMYNNIELFRVNDAGIPVEMLDMKDAVMALQFEPHGSRFAMIHAENPNAAKVKVSFYDMMKTEETVTGIVGAKQAKTKSRVPELHLIETLEGRQCNFISWSPAGHVIIMASLGDSASGTLEFYDVSSKSLVIKEHYRANQLLWDPAGRSVASVVSQPIEGGSFKFAMDNGYVLWSFQGKQLYQESFEAFYQFIWRPRKTLLSTKKIHEVRRNIKKYEKQFDKADRKRRRQKYLEETKGKREERAKIRDIISRNSTILSRHRQKHVALLGGYDSDDEKNYQINEMLVEKVLSTKEETIVL
jgi:translation initiation factor 3 subunit B